MTMSDSSSSILKASEVKLSKQKRKRKYQSNVGRLCRNKQLANSLRSFVAEWHVSLKDTPPKKAAVIFYFAKRKAKMTVETCPAAEPYAALIDMATSCDRYCQTANQRSLIGKKTLFKYATSFHEMENFPWCASPRAFQRYQIDWHRQC